MNNSTKHTLIAVGLLALFCAGLFFALTGMASTAFETLTHFLYDQQRGFSRSLSAAVGALRNGEGGALATLIGLGFLYGVFHAIGPGHGKAVISTYALTHESRLMRTAVLSFTAALIQGISAIVAVSVLMVIVEKGLGFAAMNIDDVLTPVSFAAVTLVGLYLLARGARTAHRQMTAGASPSHDRKHTHDHDHEHEHEHDHEHNSVCSCGHAHVPSAQQVEQASTWKRAALVALSVGIRPCSGAILVLVLAFGFGFAASGIAAVLAMSLGTGLTVAALAFVVQGLRWPVARVLDNWGVKSSTLGVFLMVAGGVLITGLGATLFVQALQTPSHPFL